MSVRKSVMAMIIGILLLAGGALPASAQRSCGDLYNRLMAAYQSGSPQYAEMLNNYNARCAGSAAGPAGRRGGGQCEELRLACENKERLGERGEGNCQRYRQLCQPNRLAVRFARNCGWPVSTRTSSASRAKAIAGIAVPSILLVED